MQRTFPPHKGLHLNLVISNASAMIRRSIAPVVKGIALAAVVSLLLLAGRLTTLAGFLGSFARELLAGFRDSGTQWMIFLCLVVYFTAFLLLRARGQSQSLQLLGGQPPSRLSGALARRKSGKAVRPTLWLVGAMFISAVVYALNYSASAQALTFLAGAVFGHGMAIWGKFESRKLKVESRDGFVILVAVLFVILLSVASFWQAGFGPGFEYHGQARWSGPWENPNLSTDC